MSQSTRNALKRIEMQTNFLPLWLITRFAQPYLPHVTRRVLRSVHGKFHADWTKTVGAWGIHPDRQSYSNNIDRIDIDVCVSNSPCEQISSRTDAPIWTRFLLNGCLAHWLGPYWIGDLRSKVKVTVAQYPSFLHNSLLTSLLYMSALVCLIKLKFGMPLWYALS